MNPDYRHIFFRHRTFFLLILVLHGVYFVWQWYNQDFYMVDSEEYLTESANIRNQGLFYCGDLDKPVRYDNYTKRPPVYPLILAGIYATGAGVWGVLLVQNLLSIFNFFQIVVFGEHMGLRKFQFLWNLPLILLYPSQFIYANMVMSEILFQTFLTTMVLATIWGLRYKSWKWLGAGMLFFIAGAFTKPVLYLLLVPYSAVILFVMVKWRSLVGLVHLLIPLGLWAGYMKYNENRTGYFHFSSIQNLSLLQYTTYNLLISSYGPDSALVLADDILYRSLDEPTYAEGQKLLSKECKAVIMNHKREFAAFTLKGMVNFFIDPGRFDLYHFFQIRAGNGAGFLQTFSREGYRGIIGYLKNQPVTVLFLLILIAISNMWKLAGLLVFPFLRKVPFEDKIVLVGIVVYLALLTGSSGASRFAVPIFPVLLLMNIFMVSAMADRISVSSKKKAG